MTSADSSMVDYDAVLRSAVEDSATVDETLQAIYAKFISIVGAPQPDDDGYLTCKNCGYEYKENDNNCNSCVWYSDKHKGLFLTDYNLDSWYGWHVANPPKMSSYWKQSGYVGEGRHRWTGCKCTHTNDECERQGEQCERQGEHKPEGYPPSADEWWDEESGELSEDEFNVEHSRKRGQDLLITNYIHQLKYILQKKKG